MTEPTASAPDRHPEGATHALPPSVLLGTAGVLLSLTALTVAASRLDLGPFNVVLALAIACFKASLVALFFMHLKYEHKFKAAVFLGAAAFAAIFIGFVVFDTTQYQPDIRARETQAASPAR